MIIPQAPWLDDCPLCPFPTGARLRVVEGSSATDQEAITLSLGPCDGRKPGETSTVGWRVGVPTGLMLETSCISRE